MSIVCVWMLSVSCRHLSSHVTETLPGRLECKTHQFHGGLYSVPLCHICVTDNIGPMHSFVYDDTLSGMLNHTQTRHFFHLNLAWCIVLYFFYIRFWYLRCCGCPWNRGRQHLATPLKTCRVFNRVAALPIPQLRGDGIWESAVPALGLCACRCPRKRGIIRLATMTTLPEHQSVDDCRRSLLLPRLKQLVTLRREGYIRIYLLLDGLAWRG